MVFLIFKATIDLTTEKIAQPLRSRIHSISIWAKTKRNITKRNNTFPNYIINNIKCAFQNMEKNSKNRQFNIGFQTKIIKQFASHFGKFAFYVKRTVWLELAHLYLHRMKFSTSNDFFEISFVLISVISWHVGGFKNSLNFNAFFELIELLKLYRNHCFFLLLKIHAREERGECRFQLCPSVRQFVKLLPNDLFYSLN